MYEELSKYGPMALIVAILLFFLLNYWTKQTEEFIKTIKLKDAQLEESFKERIKAAEHSVPMMTAMTFAFEEGRKEQVESNKLQVENGKLLAELKASVDILNERVKP